MSLALDNRAAFPPVALAPDVRLARARAHEAAGPSREMFALLVAAATEGMVLWLRPRWERWRLTGDGMAHLVDPGRLVIGRCRTALDIFWCAEEALRSGAAPLVVAELAEPPALTPVRRLHLAAEAGARDGAAPVCLLLTPGEGGGQGVETRWHLAPLPGWAAVGVADGAGDGAGDGAAGGRARWRLSRTRARSAPAASWAMHLDGNRPVLAPLDAAA
jgi:protein ImuA